MVGNNAVHGVDLQQVAGLVGLDYDSRPQLSPAELRNRQAVLLSILDRAIDRIPESVHGTKIPGRDRTIWNLVEHMCEIASVYQRVATGISIFDATAADAEVNGELSSVQLHSSIKDLTMRLSAETLDYERRVETYFGVASLHYVLERSTWHIAQHLRQLASLMCDVDPSIMPEIDAKLLAGLPIPIEVWD